MRDTYLDTCKGVLIFLVVFGHFLERMIGWNDDVNRVLVSTVYFVHMPAFIFISGMFFKGTDLFKKIIYFCSLLIPFQIVYVVFDSLISGNQLSTTWLMRPYWILWYLCGMIAWTLMMPLLKKTGFPVLISIILSVLIGLSPINNYVFSIGRIFTFLPFFVIGSVYGKQIVQLVKGNKQAAIYGFIVLVIIALISQFNGLASGWLYGSLSFKQLGVDPLTGTVTRLSVFLISSLGILAVLALTTLFKGKLNDACVNLGQHTLAVYLLHGLVVIALARYLTLPDQFLMRLLLCLCLSIITCALLKLDMFEKLIKAVSSVLMNLVKFKT